MQLNETMQAKVRAVIATWLKVELEEVQPGSRIVADLDGDSLDVVEITMALEEAFAVMLPDDLSEDPTVQDYFDMLAKASN